MHAYLILHCLLPRATYRKSGNFRCKNNFVVDGGYENYISLMKISAHYINTNAVRGRSYEIFLYENLSYKSFFT